MSIAQGKNRRRSIAFKLSLFILIGTTLIFLSAFFYNYYYSRKIVLKNVEENARNLTFATVNKIETMLTGVEKVPSYLAFTLEKYDYNRKELLQVIEDQITTHTEIFGSTVAFEPYTFDSSSLYFAPYFYKDKGQIKFRFLGSDAYRYFIKDWYIIPKELNKPGWSEPYFDEGGGNIIMSTYSVPFYRNIKATKKFIGVATADISLEWLVGIISRISVYRSGYAFLVSKNGVFITHPDKSLIMRESIFSLAEEAGDTSLHKIGRDMVQGGEGFVSLKSFSKGEKCRMYYAPLPSIGWSLGVVIPEDELFADIRNLNREIIIIGSAGFILLFLIIVFISRTITRPLRILAKKTTDIARGNLNVEIPVVKSNDEVGDLSRSFENMRVALIEYISNLAETTAAKERIESELKIARTIQMSFLPKQFPPFPDKEQFEIFATLEPAREVGGDLYDFFLLDEDHLFFSIGDVSDKGVPAALFMAVTKTLMKGIAGQGIEPSEILSRVNVELCKDNESMMFVTVFCGILNFRIGELVFSNAGHNPPLIIRSEKPPDWLTIPKGVFLGVEEDAVYKNERITLNIGDTLLLYTDGVTEAMDKAKNIYSDARLKTVVEEKRVRSPEVLIEKVMQSVKTFIGEEPQSDDITLLALQFKGRLEK
jgi:sigma-B regulation protein RsbU (phosphoserine phosphatase)